MQVWKPKGTKEEGGPWIEALAAGATTGSPTTDEQQFRVFASDESTTALDAIITALSRAEVLWGQGTTITEDDWFAARDI